MHLRWVRGGHDQLVLERETPTEISIRGEVGVVEFLVLPQMHGLSGALVSELATACL